MTTFTGIGIGLTAGTGTVYRLAAVENSQQSFSSVDEELQKLKDAVAVVEASMNELSTTEDQGDIFEAMAMLVADVALVESAELLIRNGTSAGAAYIAASEEMAELMMGDSDFEARIGDLRDLAKRVAAEVSGQSVLLNLPTGKDLVLVADDFAPADTAQFTPDVKAVITKFGGPTSHVAIICRSRGIPALVSVSDADQLTAGEQVLVDPVANRVVVDADISSATQPINFVSLGETPVIPVYANASSIADSQGARGNSATGIGLFRTEFMYLNAAVQPDVETQANEFAEIIRSAPKGELIFRTIDAGSDKPVPFLDLVDEENPALGIRGFRLLAAHGDFIRDQLLAIKKAEQMANRSVSVMAPMIATVAEAKDFAKMAREAGLSSVGIMVETPAIIYQLAKLTEVLDFISIGSNDLSQYLFAADRMHPKLGSLLDPWQPGLLLAIQATVNNAGKLKVGVCGEAASDPLLAIVLAGLGVNTVSASLSAVDRVTEALSSVDLETAKSIANAVLGAEDALSARAVAMKLVADN